ncbi:MAG: S24 family peptidase [Eggerthellaceae bacterium]|nr:S24 family peptidase [Eggerthellaceae bacterium]
MIQLCKIFDEPIAAFYPLASSKTANGTSGSCSEVALYGSIISGKPLAFIPIEGMKPCPLELRRKYPQGFFLRVKGQAMNNILPDGSFAFIDPLQSAPIDNRVYALCLNDDDAIIRRIKKLGNGFELLPDSNDPTLKPSIFDYADEGSNRIVVVGRVVWMMLPFDWEL